MEVRGLGVTASILSVCFVWSATTADEVVHPICPLVLHQERVDREELELAVDLALSRLAAAESIFTLVDQLWEKGAVERMVYLTAQYDRDVLVFRQITGQAGSTKFAGPVHRAQFRWC
jgi:hypothetical protein